MSDSPTRIPDELRYHENNLIADRRQNAGLPPASDAAPVAGLALSGGGIRSATFNLGVLQALATKKLLRRFDYLSTVSGGGYIGSFFGAWVNRRGIDEAETGLSGADGQDRASLPVRYLRENGRYLTPNGSTDAWLAFWMQLRSQLTLLWLLLLPVAGTFLVLEAVKMILGLVEVPMTSDSPVVSFLWPWVGAFALVTLLPLGTGYWFVGAARTGKFPIASIVVAVAATVAALFSGNALWSELTRFPAFPADGGWWDRLRTWGRAVRSWDQWGDAKCWLIFTALSVTMAVVIVIASRAGSAEAGKRRRAFTNQLGEWAAVVAVMALVAAMDTLGQWLAREVQSIALASAGPLTLAAVISFGQRLGAWLAGLGDGERLKLPAKALAWLAGLAVATIILGSIAASMHVIAQQLLARERGVAAFVLPAPTADGDDCCCCEGGKHDAAKASVDASSAATAVAAGKAKSDPKSPASDGGAPAQGSTLKVMGILVGSGALAWLLAALFGRDFRFVNHSSMHRLYSARLTRAYVGATNPARTGNESGENNFDATEVLPNDDIPWQNYRPDLRGGPLHLVNVTVNETVSGQSNVDKEDRHGLGMAVGPAMLSTGPRANIKAPDNAIAPLSIGEWVGISGAAFTTGMGANTCAPLSFLLTLFNVRLGFWWDSKKAFRHAGQPPVYPGKVKDQKMPVGLAHKLLPVQTALLEEMTARFHGPTRDFWYLSDGGHFENTACYELLRRKVPLIVCCDCGADDTYSFEDLANMVRKARIDYGAEVTFMTREEAEKFSPALGSLEDLQFPEGETKNARFAQRHGAVARVKYRDGAQSLLVLIKPTLTGDLPIDILQYDSQEQAFPQETTLDQFFDEAQWESYRKLGRVIGEKIFDTPNAPAWERLIEDLNAKK